MVAAAVSAMLKESSVGVDVTWTESADIVMRTGSSVMACIGVALTRELAGRSVLVLCRGCGDPFIASRKGWRFCDDCRKIGAPNRAEVADHRARARARA